MDSFGFPRNTNAFSIEGVPIIVTGLSDGQVLTYKASGNYWYNGTGGGGGGGVTSLNSLTGALNLTSTGSTIGITPSGTTIDLEVTLVAGTGIGVSTLTISNTGLLSASDGTHVSTGAIVFISGTGIGVSNSSGNFTVSNNGVTSAVAGTGIGVSAATGAVTITNNGVTSLSTLTGAVGFSSPNSTMSFGTSGSNITADVSTSAVLEIKTLSQSTPNSVFGTNAGQTSIPTTASATAVMMGLSGTGGYLTNKLLLTPANSGIVIIKIALNIFNATGVAGSTFSLYYGTSTAPNNGVSTTGTNVGGNWTFGASAATSSRQCYGEVYYVLTGLTKGTQYWFDLSYLTTNTADATTVSNAIGYVYEV